MEGIYRSLRHLLRVNTLTSSCQAISCSPGLSIWGKNSLKRQFYSSVDARKHLFPAATLQHDTAGFVRLIRGKIGPILAPGVTSKTEVKLVTPLEDGCSGGSHLSLAYLSAVHCTWIPVGFTCTVKNK